MPLVFVGFSLIFVAFVGFVGFSISLAIELDSTALSGLAAGQTKLTKPTKAIKINEKTTKTKSMATRAIKINENHILFHIPIDVHCVLLVLLPCL